MRHKKRLLNDAYTYQFRDFIKVKDLSLGLLNEDLHKQIVTEINKNMKSVK